MAKTSMMSRFGRWLKRAVVQDVPDEVALCEFDCRKKQCLRGDWSTCERRLETLADRNRGAAD